MNRDFEPGLSGRGADSDPDSRWDETLPGASSTAGKLRIPVEAELPSHDMLQDFCGGGPYVSLESLVAKAAESDEVGLQAVEALAAIRDQKVPDLLLKIHRGTRDYYGRIRESARVRDAAARALAANPRSFGIMLAKLYNTGKPLERNEAIHVVARRAGIEGTKALIFTARQNALRPTGPESVDLARIAMWIGEVKGQNAGWRGNQRGVSRHLEGGLGA